MKEHCQSKKENNHNLPDHFYLIFDDDLFAEVGADPGKLVCCDCGGREVESILLF
jgi:hypothetical protein